MKTRKTMLEYSKQILNAVSFDPHLYEKEYRKSLAWLSKDEAHQLKFWVKNQNNTMAL